MSSKEHSPILLDKGGNQCTDIRWTQLQRTDPTVVLNVQVSSFLNKEASHNHVWINLEALVVFTQIPLNL